MSGYVKLVRDYENTAKKVASFKNHLRFSLHCKHHDVMPAGLRLASTVRGEKANKILHRAERSLLGVRIGQTVRRLDILEKKREVLKQEVSQKLPRLQSEVENFVTTAQLRQHTEVKQRQQTKFRRILDKKTKNNDNVSSQRDNLAQQCMSRWVKNCSDRILSDPELSVLKKGLNFAVTPKRLPVIDMVTATESACRQLGGGDGQELRSKVVNILSRGNVGLAKDQNITKEERDALDGLKKEENIMVLPADKGK
jgi:hypothetical protein